MTIFCPDLVAMSCPDLVEQLDKWKSSLESEFSPVEYSDLEALICSLQPRDVSLHLLKVLPLSLRLLDHHHVPNKFLGLRCVAHIKDSVPERDLRSQGLDLLFLHSLKNGLFVDSDEFLEQLLPLQLAFLHYFKTESKPFSDHVDDVADVILQNMELTSKVERKRVYWKNLSNYLLFPDLSIKYSKRIVSILEDQLSFPLQDSVREMFLNVIQSTHSFVVSAECRMKDWQDRLVFIIIKFVHANIESVSREKEMVRGIISICHLLSDSDETSFTEKIRCIQSTGEKNPDVIRCLALLQLV